MALDTASLDARLMDKVYGHFVSFEYHRGGDCIRTGPAVYDDKVVLPHGVIGQITGSAVVLSRTGFPKVRIEDGEGYFVAPDVRTIGEYPTPGQSLTRWAHVNYRLMDCIDIFSLFDIPCSFPRTAGNRISVLLKALQEVHSTPAGPALPGIIRHQSLGFQLFEIIMKYSVFREGGADYLNDLTRFNEVLAFISTNLSTDITRGRLAKLACMSETHFHLVFKRVFGMAPLTYVKSIRMKRAQTFLTSTDRSVEAVGEAVGYADPFHFSRQFKSYVGVGPREYRKKSRERVTAIMDVSVP